MRLFTIGTKNPLAVSLLRRGMLIKIGIFFTFFAIVGNILASKNQKQGGSDRIGEAKEASGTDNTGSLFPKPTPSFTYSKPQKTSATTLSKIVQEAVRSHPGIEADRQALDAADDVIDQAKAGYMPSVDFRASIGRENIQRSFDMNVFNPLPSVGSLTTTRSDPSISIRQTLFDGMGTASRVARARSQRSSAHGALGLTIDTATIDAASATIDLRRLQRLLRIVDNNIRFHEIMKKKIEEIVEAGAAPVSDLFQVESRLKDTLVSKSNIVSELGVVKAKFVEVVGKEPPDSIKRIRLPGYLVPTTPDMAVRMALDHNNAIKVAKSNIQVAESTYQEAGSKLVPTITFEVEAERDRNMNATAGYQNRLTAMVVARHNIFSGGADFAKSRETVKRLTETHARLNLVRRQTERTIRSAWGEAKNAKAKSFHLTNLIREKRRIRNTYLTEFSIGKRTLMDILDAASEVFVTEASRTTTDATADINMVILSVGTGQFKGYINRAGGEDDITTESGSSDDLDPSSLMFTNYPVAGGKEKKRKSLFETRKESREKAMLDKGSA